jgi:small-conductance mechanosensitive channel
MRNVQLVTLDDNLVTVPTSKFLTDPVASANAGALDCMVVVDFFVTAAADHDRAMEIVGDAVLASKYLYLGKPFTVLVSNELRHDARVVVQLRAKAYVFDAQYEKAFASDITDRVLTAFRREEIPMPG